jgi:hypothetical protein
MLLLCIKHIFIGFIISVIFTNILENIANIENEFLTEKDIKTKICYSYLIDNIKQKDIFGENLNFTKFCDKKELIPKVTYHLNNFRKCYEGRYVGQPMSAFSPLIICREKFAINSFIAIHTEVKDLLQEQKFTTEILWEKICSLPNILIKLDNIRLQYDCL